MSSILDELVEAMTQEKDPKRLTQKQQDRLAKRVREIAEQHQVRVDNAFKEKTKQYKVTHSNTYVDGIYVTHPTISQDAIGREVLAERQAGKRHSFDTNALLADFAKHCKTSNPSSFSIRIADYMPEARKRVAKQEQALEKLNKRHQEVKYQITFDMNEIIDAAIFYRSEHILGVLEKFANKEYTL